MPSIDWRHDGRRLIIPVLILAPAPSTDFSGVDGVALVDTGSTTSGVTSRVIDKLRLHRLGKRPLASAQGEGQSERCAFRIGLTPDEDATPAFPFVFEDVIGFELANSFTFAALIGMDILRQCDLSIDRSGGCSLRFGR